MDDPVLYNKGNMNQYTDSLELITKYLPLLICHNKIENEDDEEKAVDIGCGSGSVTWEILRPLLPKNIRLLGSDIEPKMVKFASETYPELKTFTLNIETEVVPLDLRQEFRYIFSFYCLHWIKDIRQAMQNIYDMLKPGGQLFTHYVVSHVFFNPFRILSTMDKWKDYMSGDKKITSYKFDDENVDKNVRKVLEDIGFKVSICEVVPKHSVVEDIEELKNYLKPIIVGYSQMQENLKEEVLNNTVDLIFQENIWKKANQNNYTKLIISYRLMIILATKPY